MRTAHGHRAVWALLTAAGIALATAACGGGGGKPATGPARAASASAGASARPQGLSPAPSGLPPMASMPPPGVMGSKKAKTKLDAALPACSGVARPPGKDLVEAVKRLGDACAAPAKMKPVGSLIRGQQADRDAHQEHKLRVDANKCYRVVIATDESAREVVMVMRDSAGDVVAESPSAALPHEGAVCFTTADEVTLMIAVGAGQGAYAAQVWSE